MNFPVPHILFSWFDCAGTLMHPVEPIGEVYARTAAAFGIQRNPAQTDTQFRAAWKRAAKPTYPDGPDENMDRAWWRNIVRESLCPALSPKTDDGLGISAAGDARPWASGAASPPPYARENMDAAVLEDCFQALFNHYAQPEAWALYPDVRPVLESLRGRVRMGVLSNFDSRLYPLLEGHKLTPFFEIVVTSSEAAACKPDPAIFHRAASLADVPPENCLLAGDDPINDWQGAAGAGWQVFKVDRPGQNLKGLLSFPH